MPAPSGSTPTYGFPYLLESDVPDVATASEDLALAIETEFLATIPPTPQHTGFTPLVGTYTGQPLIKKLVEFSGTTNGTTGALATTFATAFPNGVLYGMVIPIGTNPMFTGSIPAATLTTATGYFWQFSHPPGAVDIVLGSAIGIFAEIVGW